MGWDGNAEGIQCLHCIETRNRAFLRINEGSGVVRPSLTVVESDGFWAGRDIPESVRFAIPALEQTEAIRTRLGQREPIESCKKPRCLEENRITDDTSYADNSVGIIRKVSGFVEVEVYGIDAVDVGGC